MSDPGIILEAGNIKGPDPAQQQNNLISMFSLAQQVQQARQQTAKQNALLKLFSDPNSIDPKTGDPTPQVGAALYKIDPQMGLQMNQQILDAKAKRAQEQNYQTEQGKTRHDALSSIAGAAHDAYQAVLDNGGSPADAAQAGIKARNSALDNSGGLLSNDDISAQKSRPWDNQEVLAFAKTNPEFNKTQQQKITDKLAQDRLDLQAKHDNAMENLTARGQNIRIDTGQAGKWQVLTDPKANTQYRYNPETGESTTLDGKGPYSPGGAAKISSGQARSAAALAAQKFVEDNPNATPEDIAQFAADFGKTGKSVKDFSTGQQGNMVRSFNVAISHLNTLDGLVDALGNGDTQVINKASQAFKQQFGSAAPTNFDAAKAIVGDEIVKAIVGGGGALADRENAQNQINRAESPEQLKSVIKTYKELMGGQLKGLKKQYEDTTGRKDFDTRLSDDTKTELGMGGAGAKADHSKMSDADLKKILGIP